MFHDQRFYVALSFVLFFVFFGRRLWRVMADKLDQRAEDIRKDLDEASHLRREAEKMLEDATREREQALTESRALIQRSRLEADAIAERARQEAEAVAKRREQMALDRIASSEKAAIAFLRERAASAAVAAVTALLEEKMTAKESGMLLEQSLEALPGLLKSVHQDEQGKNAA